MIEEAVTFYSDGLALKGKFFLPDVLDGPGAHPLIVPCSGFTGLCDIHPARFARYLTARGYPCFGFDYRGFGDSEGVPLRVVLEEQVRDIVCAAAFAAGDPRIDPERVVLLGWGMGGGLILDAARGLDGVAGLIAVNGFYDGARVQRAHRGEDGLLEFRRRVEAERRARARTGALERTDPFDLYPLDPVSRGYVESVLFNERGYANDGYAFELGESLLRWRPEAHAPDLDLPLLIAHGDQNHLHPVSEAESLRARYGGPVELYWVEKGGHTEWMLDEDARFQALGARIAGWLGERFAA